MINKNKINQNSKNYIRLVAHLLGNFLIFILLWITSTSTVYAAVAVDATSTNTGTGTTIDVTHTVSGSNRLMLVGISSDASATDVSSVVWDPTGANQSLTLVTSCNRTSANGEMWIYYLVAPTTGTGLTLRVSFNNNAAGSVVGVMSYTGVDQSTPLGTCVTDSADPANISATVSSETGGMVMDTAASDEALSVGADQTQRWNITTPAVGAGSTEPGAASATMSWSGGSTGASMGAVPIKPAASGFNVSGTFHGISESGGDPGQCDGSTANLSLRVNGGTAVTTSCADISGTFTFSGVSASANDTITIYSTGVDKANRVYVSDGTADTGMDIYEDTVIVADEQDGTVTIPDLWDYDSTGDDTNMLFNAVDSIPDTLTVESGIELHIWTGDTFDPGGTVTTTGTSGDLHVDDSAVIYLDTSTNTLAGPVTVDTGATLNLDASVNFGGSLTSTGTTQASTGTHTFTAGGTITGGGTINFYDLATSTTGTTTISSAVSTDSDVSVGTGTTLKINADLAVNGGALTTVTNGIVTYDSGTPTVTIAGAGNIGVSGGSGAITFYNLTTSGSSQTTTLQQNITVAHALSVGASHVFAIGTTSPTIGSNSISDSGDITIASGASTSHTSGTVTILNTTNAADWSGPGTFTAYNLTIGNGSAMTVDNESNDLPLDVNNNFTISASATFQASSTASFNVGGSWSNSVTGVFTANTGTVTFDATSGTPTITSAGDPFYTIVLNDAGNNITFTLEDALDINGNLTITGGTLDTKSAESNSINIEGTWTNNDLFEANTSVVTFDGDSGTPTIKTNGSTSAFYDLTFNDGAAEITWTLSDALYVDRNLTITDATLNTGSNYSVYIGSSAGGSWSNSDTFEANSSTINFQATAGSPTITTGGSASAFYNLVFNDAAGEVTFALSDQLYVDNNLTITDATVNSNGQNITIGGSWTNDDIFTEGTGTVTFTTASAATIDSNCITVSTCTNENFYNLVINKTSSTDTVTLTNFGIRVTGTLTITTGTLVQGAYNIQAEGATAVSVGANGTWSNTSTGDISLAGNVSNSGTVTLKANNNCGSTNDIAITAVSGTPSWSGGGTYTLYDVSVTGQNAAVAITVNSGTNGGSNTGSWTFSDSCPAGATHTNSHFSLSLWLNPTTSIATKAIMVEDFEIRLVTDGSGNPLCQISNSVSWQTAATSSVALTTGSWQHVACTYDQRTLRVFVNGELTGSQNLTVAIDDTANSWRFGDDEGATYGDYNGKMDDVHIYNRALSAVEVRALYNWAPGPVAHWKLDENTDTTAYDTSANSVTNNGTLTSNPVWAPGKFGSGIKLIPGSYVNVPDNDDSIDFTVTDSFTWSAWINSSDWASDPILYNNYGSGNPGYRLRTTSAGKPACAIHDGTAGPETIANTDIRDGNWHFLTCIRNVATDTIYVYIDGVLENSTNDTTTGTLVNTTAFTIGRSSNTSTGIVDDARIYNYARTPGQIIEDMNAGHPAPGSPIGSAVAHWKFDEGSLNTCSGGTNDFCDSSINANDLAYSTTTGGITNSGKFGKAFSGATNTRASKTDDADLDFAASEGITLSTWFKRDTVSAAEYLIYKENGFEGYTVYMDSDGDIVFGIGDTNSASFPEESIGGALSKNYDDNAWHNAVAVKDGTSSIKLYVDGKEIASDTSLIVDATLENAGTFYLADANATDGTDEFLGTIDEVQIFRSALTADQIKLLYNQSSTAVWGAVSTDSSNNPSWSANDAYCPPGQGTACTAPVGEWKFDENTGVTMYDTSGKGNNLTATSTTWETGKFGSALGSDGTNGSAQNSSVTSDLIITGDITVSAWINRVTTNTDGIITLNPDGSGEASNILYEFVVKSTGDYLQLSWQYGSLSTDESAQSTAELSNWSGNWLHVAAVRDTVAQTVTFYENGKQLGSTVSYTNNATGGTATPNIIIAATSGGASPSNVFGGKIDEAKVYNYTRTPAQIAWEYNRGGPVAWYKFDESSWTNNCSTDTVYDSSKTNSSHGDSCPNGSGQTTPETGKRNNAIHFDDVDDYISIPDHTSLDLTSNISISAWVNTDANEADNVIVSKGTSYEMGINADGDIYWYNGATTEDDASSSVGSGTWHHVVITNNDTTVTYYVDGVSTGTDASGIGADNATALTLGYDGTNYFDGKIDDVRIFNYALTAQQVKLVMNDGAVSFAPVTGSP